MNTDNIKAVLFDLDGVVFNTEPQYTVFWGAQCREFHPDKPGLEHMIKGQTLVQIFDKHFGGELKYAQDIIIQRLNEFEKTMTFNYIDGFIEFIIMLRSKGIKTAIVTSSNIAKMEFVYHSCKEFKAMFDAILTSEDFERSKPDPDCYEKAASRLGIERSECIVFEDSFNGLLSGRAAGMRVVGLSTTNSAESIANYADIVIENYKGFLL